MRKAAVVVLVAGSYTMMIGILLLLVIALTTAFADGWNLRAASKRVVDRAPQFSPDGSQIAFIRSEDGIRRLWVMTADGSDQQPLARAARFSWAGKGHALLFTRNGARVFRIDAEGGPAAPVRERLRPPATSSGRERVVVRGNHLYLRDSVGKETALT